MYILSSEFNFAEVMKLLLILIGKPVLLVRIYGETLVPFGSIAFELFLRMKEKFPSSETSAWIIDKTFKAYIEILARNGS